MAFGKDSKRIDQMNFRQTVRRGTIRAPKTGGGGAYFSNRYQPPTTGSDLIRIIPGRFLHPRVDKTAKDFVYNEGEIIMDPYPHFQYVSYIRKSGKDSFQSCVGSEGPLGEFKGKGDPCLAKDWFWWEWRQRQKHNSKKPRSFSRREMYAITVLVQAPFYKVPQIYQGKPKVNPNTKEPYMEWKAGSKRGNDEYAAAGYEKKQGHLMHWSLGTAHWKTLVEYSDTLVNHCASCGGNDTIIEEALICQNCGESVVEMKTTTLSDAELDHVRTNEVACPHCKHRGYLEDVYDCNNCNNPVRATLFDFDLEVKRVETSNDGGKTTALQILRALGPRQIDAKYGEDLRKPLPLDKIFAPTPIEKQLELYGDVPDDDDIAAAGINDDDEEDEEPEEEHRTVRTPSNKNHRPYGSR